MNPHAHRLFIIIMGTILEMYVGCVSKQTANSLAQHTGVAGSTISRPHPPYYPNTAGNIVAPPGNPAGNPAGSPPIINGTENQSSGWPAGR